MGILVKLADNVLYSCTAAVGADRQKESHLGGVLCATSGPGWAGPKLIIPYCVTAP